MKPTKWAMRAACALLIIIAVLGVAGAAGTQGSEGNPLVTLSYLNEVVVPEILKQVEERMNVRTAQVEQEALARNAGTFLTLELAEGETLSLSAGAQVVVRSGKAVSIDPMTDLTAGESWSGGGELPLNHLFLAAGDGQTVSAHSAVTLMVQGDHSKS